MTRRNFIAASGAALAAFYLPGGILKALAPETTRDVYERIVRKASEENWNALDVHQIISKFASELIGTPYVGGTLEVIPEACTVDLTGLDCVTLFETSLDAARCFRRQAWSFKDLLAEVEFTRYRGGVQRGYASRLHYTSDWIAEGIVKGVVADRTKSLGGKPFRVSVGFMSENYKLYKQLAGGEDALRREIESAENRLNGMDLYYIPTSKISKIEDKLHSGDIIAIRTSKKGLDYSHTGLVYRDESGGARFLHASSKKKQVTLDVGLAEYVAGTKSNLGITVLCPV
ncbi:MAG: N-acetylmuramoyl-L-alanine amidase-like domain-containing protein [Chloroflexota bacterium]